MTGIFHHKPNMGRKTMNDNLKSVGRRNTHANPEKSGLLINPFIILIHDNSYYAIISHEFILSRPSIKHFNSLFLSKKSILLYTYEWDKTNI